MRRAAPEKDATGLPAGGLYVLLVRVRRPRRLRVGKRGLRTFRSGWYCYVGRARRALEARLRRHARPRKRRHWHIDGLTARAEVVGAWVLAAPAELECVLAGELARRGELVAGFGASDCGCGGHLVRFGTEVEAGSAVRRGWSRLSREVGSGPVELLWWRQTERFLLKKG